MDFRQLEIFLAVIEEASVTRAAGRVYLSPGAVSLQIHHLADELKTDLFVRSGKRLLPTPQALRLAEAARGVTRQIREIENSFANDPKLDTRPFHLATGLTTLVHRMGPILRKLRKRMPATRIEITIAATEEMVAGLLERRFDLALISLPVNDEQLTIMPLFNEELLFMRPSAAPVRGWHVGAVKPEELAAAPFILYPKRSNMRTMIDRYFATLGISPEVVMEADDTEAMRLMVEAGFGYSILPEFALRRQPRRFRTLRVPDHALMRAQALAMARTGYPRALTVEAANFIQAEIAAAGRERFNERSSGR
jgi:DNA-binding transcriptional LysR family regulator